MSAITNQIILESALEDFRNYLKNKNEAERKEVKDNNLEWLSYLEDLPLNNFRL